MTTAAAAMTILDLRAAGHSVRRDDTGGAPRIMIAPSPPADLARRVRDNRAAVLDLLATEDKWPADIEDALTALLAWNAAIEARPQEAAERWAKRNKTKETQEDLL